MVTIVPGKQLRQYAIFHPAWNGCNGGRWNFRFSNGPSARRIIPLSGQGASTDRQLSPKAGSDPWVRWQRTSDVIDRGPCSPSMFTCLSRQLAPGLAESGVDGRRRLHRRIPVAALQGTGAAAITGNPRGPETLVRMPRELPRLMSPLSVELVELMYRLTGTLVLFLGFIPAGGSCLHARGTVSQPCRTLGPVPI